MIGLSSIVLGLLFVLILTRTMSSVDYGTWGLISGLFVYGLIFDHVFTFWAVRNSARGIESTKTSIVSSALFSTLGVVIYIIAAFIVGSEVESNINIIFFGAILIPLIFLNRILTSIISGWKPHIAAFGVLIFTSFEFLAALFLIHYFVMSIIGVIISVAIGYIVSNSVLLFTIRNKIKHKFQFHFLKKWLKLSWLPLYPTIGQSLLLLDITIFTVITGSVVGIAFWSAVMVISKLVESSGSFAGPVYAKL
jgi:O-antigen/teichoic acid export membrane protein